jgi:hypothetical protein
MFNPIQFNACQHWHSIYIYYDKSSRPGRGLIGWVNNKSCG